MEPTRYTPVHPDAMVCESDGTYVRYDDCAKLRALVQELTKAGHRMRLEIGNLTVIENAMEDDDGRYGLDDLNAAWMNLAQAAMDWDAAKSQGFTPTNTTDNG